MGFEEAPVFPTAKQLIDSSPTLPAPFRFHTDPSGTFVQYQAKAIGSGSEGAQTALQDGYRADMTLKEAEELILATLKQVMEEKVTSTNVDIAKVNPEYHLYTPAEVEEVFARL